MRTSNSVRFHPEVLFKHGQTSSLSHPSACVLSLSPSLRKARGGVRGKRQGLLRVSQELRGECHPLGSSEVLVTCQINIFPAQLTSAPHTHTHTHTKLQYPGGDGIGSFFFPPEKRRALTRACVYVCVFSVAERSGLMAGR